MIERLQSHSEEIWGREFNLEESGDALAAFLYEIASSMVEDERREEERRRTPLVDRLRFLVGGVTIAVRARAIASFPNLAGIAIGKYKSSLDGQKFSIIEVVNSLGGVDGLASEVVHKIEAIRELREAGDEFALLDDEEMEMLRKALFIANKVGVREEFFCKFGEGVIKDLTIFVADYERMKGI